MMRRSQVAVIAVAILCGVARAFLHGQAQEHGRLPLSGDSGVRVFLFDTTAKVGSSAGDASSSSFQIHHVEQDGDDVGPFVRTLKRVACHFDIAESGLTEGENACCYEITVPQTYNDPAHGKPFTLSILRVVHDPAIRDAAPVLYSNPGPGFSYRGMSQPLQRKTFGSFLDLSRNFNRPIITFDTRLIGQSRPFAMCHDADPLVVTRQCAAQIRQDTDVDLVNVNTRWVVRDIEVIKRAFVGARKVHFLGHSYASVEGAVYAQAFPDSVASVMLSGIAHPAYAAEHLSSWHAFKSVADRISHDCMRDHVCNRRFPDVPGMFDAFIEVASQSASTVRGINMMFYLRSLMDASGGDLHDQACLVPLYLDAVVHDDQATVAAIESFISNFQPYQLEDPSFINPTVLIARGCMDSARMYASRRDDDDLRAAPEIFNLLNKATLYDMDRRFADCVNVGALREENKRFELNEAVTVDVPVMVVVSTYDADCPVVAAEGLARDLPNVTRLLASGRGHFAPPRGNACEMQALKTFADDPSRYVEPECVKQIRPNFPTRIPDWLLRDISSK